MMNQQLAAQMNPQMGMSMGNQLMTMQPNPVTAYGNIRPA